MSLVSHVGKWFDKSKLQPTQHTIADFLSTNAAGVDDEFGDRVDGRSFDAGVTYFGLRLVGLHLVDARRFATEQLPLCVCLAEFEAGGEKRSVPFSIGPDTIRDKLNGEAKAAWIEFKNLTVITPTPTNDCNLSLYMGLYSVPGKDLVKTLLNVVGHIGTALSIPAAGPALKVSEAIYESFGALLGFSEVEQVVGAVVGNALTGRGSGYLLIGNADPSSFPLDTARVVKGRLHWPYDSHNGAAVTEFDHIVFALERFDTVVERKTGLAESLFGRWWGGVRKAGSPDAMKEALERLRDAISASSEVTEDDRLRLLVAYGSAAESLMAVRWPSEKRTDRGLSRGFGQELSEAAVKLEGQDSSDRARRTSDAVVIERLLIAAEKVAGFPGLPSVSAEKFDNPDQADVEAILDFASTIKFPSSSEVGAGRRSAAMVARASVWEWR